MLPFGVTIPATVPQGSEIPEGLINNPVYRRFSFTYCLYRIVTVLTINTLCRIWRSLSAMLGRDGSVSIAIRYGLDGPGIESQLEVEIFRTRPDRPCGPRSLIYSGYRIFPGGKEAGAWRWPPTPSTAEVKERVELYLYSPLWAFVDCSRVKFTLLLPLLYQLC